MDSTEQALWDIADAGVVQRDTLPEPVRQAMQEVVDGCVWTCEHVAAAADMPAGALEKLCLAGGRAISCMQPSCVMDCHDVAFSTRLRDCVLCGHRVPSYAAMFVDDAAGLWMRAPVCYPCASPGGALAEWAGIPTDGT